MLDTMAMPGTLPKIAALETRIVSTYLPGTFRVSHGDDAQKRDHVIVRLVTDDGVVGYGEASPLTFFTGETAESVQMVIERYLAPLVLGAELPGLIDLHRAWNRAFPGHGAAKCAIDCAIHDALARRANCSVAALFGAKSGARLPLYKAIGFGDPAGVVADGERLWDAGFRSFKLKIGEGTKRDIAKLAALRERFGAEIEIIVDGNTGYAPQEAVRFLQQTTSFEIAYIEQPVPADDIEGLTFVRAHGGVPVMADESVHTLRDAHRLIAAGAVDYLGIKLIKTGGVYPASRIAALADACGVSCVVISPFDTQLGVAAAAHLAATFPAPLAAQGLGTFVVASGETERQLHVVDGLLTVPDAVGMGVTPESGVFADSERRP